HFDDPGLHPPGARPAEERLPEASPEGESEMTVPVQRAGVTENGDSAFLSKSKSTPKRTIVEKACDQFLRSLRERNASPHTIKAYTGDLDTFCAYIGPRAWKSIDHVTVRGFLSHLYEKGLSKTSVARALAAVRSLYRWLAQEGVVEQNPATLVST